MEKETAKQRDHDLLRRVQTGDMVAFSELVDNYRDRLMNVIGRMPISHEEAEDIVQESFVRVYQHRDSFDFKHCFSTWLYTIALNLARNELRKKKRYKFLDIFDLQNKEVETAVEAEIPSNLGPAIENAVASLPDKYKTAFLLRDIEEMSYEEIARILSVPLGTGGLGVRVHRSRSGSGRTVGSVEREDHTNALSVSNDLSK